MKRIFNFTLFLMLSLTPSFSIAADFVDGFEDVPLMRGLHQIENQNFSFGNEESGLTEAILTSKSQMFDNVRNHYKRVLPELGWKLENESDKNFAFKRENDILEFSLINNRPLKILISLKSKN